QANFNFSGAVPAQLQHAFGRKRIGDNAGNASIKLLSRHLVAGKPACTVFPVQPGTVLQRRNKLTVAHRSVPYQGQCRRTARNNPGKPLSSKEQWFRGQLNAVKVLLVIKGRGAPDLFADKRMYVGPGGDYRMAPGG